MKKSTASADAILEEEEKLARLEYELQDRYCQMGKKLLELAVSEQEHINALVDAIIDTRRHLSKMKAEIQCAHCLAYNDGQNKFCRRCGMPLRRARKHEEQA